MGKSRSNRSPAKRFSVEEQVIIYSFMQEGLSEEDAIDYAQSCGVITSDRRKEVPN